MVPLRWARSRIAARRALSSADQATTRAPVSSSGRFMRAWMPAVEVEARPQDAQLVAALGLVVAGVQQRRVAFARALEDVGGLLEHDHAPAADREAARDGAADDAGADHRDVERAVGGRGLCRRGFHAGCRKLTEQSYACHNADHTGKGVG